MRGIYLLLWLFCATLGHAQPRLVRFGGSFRAADGATAQTMESVTLSVYRDQTGGDALWHEIQNVVVDSDSHYSVLLGATLNSGMPVELFASGELRWLGVQFNRLGEAEQPRVLLVSVPYALKAADAETLGGKPASAYMLSAPSVGTDAREPTTTAAVVKPKATPANSGQPNYIGKFANTTDLIDSAMYEVNGNVGIFTTTPAISLDVRTGALPQMGIAGTTEYLTFFASDQYGPAIYWDPAKDMRFGKGGSGLYNPYGFVEQVRIQSSTGNVGIGTQGPLSKLDVAGDINFTSSVLYQGHPILLMPGGVSNATPRWGSRLWRTTLPEGETPPPVTPRWQATLREAQTPPAVLALWSSTRLGATTSLSGGTQDSWSTAVTATTFTSATLAINSIAARSASAL